MMRIGMVVPGFSADPSDWCIPALRHLARSLAVRDDVRVIAIRYPYQPARYVIDGAETIALGGALRHRLATAELWRTTLGVLRQEHQRRPFDVLHAFWATESGLVAALAGRWLGVPTLVSLAGGELVALRDIRYGDQRIAWERLKVAASLRLSTAVSAGSHQLAGIADSHLGRRPGQSHAYAAPGEPHAPTAITATQPRRREPRYAAPRVHVAPLGVDLDLFSPAPEYAPASPGSAQHPVPTGQPRNPTRLVDPDPGLAVPPTGATGSATPGPRLLHVGTLTPVKDHVLLLRALALVRRRGIPATLEVVGDGPLRPQLQRLTHALELSPIVHFRGEIGHADLPAVYRAADACVISSRHEAQCMAALEAAACGAPVVGTRVGVIPELTTAVAPVGDTGALADAIVTVLTGRASISRSRSQARDAVTGQVRATFGLETCADRFRRLYISLGAA
jgi:glycosyltransferase involved in cell wall biosynthesis